LPSLRAVRQRVGRVDREKAGEEARRLAEQLEWALHAFRSEMEREPRQAFEKAFLAWKTAAALAALAAILSDGEELLNRLEELGAVSVGPSGELEVHVKTSNVVKVLYVLGELGPREAAVAARRLLKHRKEAFMLHSSFYDDPLHSGFIDWGEAAEAARALVREVEAVARLVRGLLEL